MHRQRVTSERAPVRDAVLPGLSLKLIMFSYFLLSDTASETNLVVNINDENGKKM